MHRHHHHHYHYRLYRYIDIDWNIRIKKSSNEIKAMHVPTAIIELQIEDNNNNTIPTSLIYNPTTTTTNSNSIINIKKVDFELSKEALGTMLDGLGKIRDQLSLMKS